MPVVNIIENGRKIVCEKGDNLLKILHENGVFIENPCNGTGVCGKCRITVLSGDVSEIEDTERRLLKDAEIADGVRLACMTKVLGDVDIELPMGEKGSKVLTEGYIPHFERDSFEGGCGVAVDIGTTTVALSIVDLKSGKELAQSSQINAQKRFGLDVLTRITYEYDNPENGKRELQNAIVSQLDSMIRSASLEAEISCSDIAEIVVSANCTMMHTLLGVDARSLGKAPYKPVFTASQSLMCGEIGLNCCKGAKLYCLPQVSAYIGADIVAGAYVCDMEHEKGKTLFIDIGTNGEIVLADNGRLLCCSCAAGPALEGTNISCGMRAAEGAVEDVTIDENSLMLKVIGDVPPVGICGSGILAIVRELVKNGIVKPSGVFIKKSADTDERLIEQGTKRAYKMSKNLIITQDDVRQVQLAKGAVLSGFTALLNKAGIDMGELDKVLIAGQFGAHLPAHSLIGVGILPAEVSEKLVYVGNSSKTGAYMALLSKKIRAEMELLAHKMEYMELAETENYEMLFAESMRFPRLNGGK